MGTRSVIVRPTPVGGFYGTYCHYDGYPAHQGRVLFEAVTGHFGGDTDAACRYLIDEHPAGWSVLHGDFTIPPGYRLPTDPDDLRNQCYCHGDRHDPPRPPLDDHTASDAWVDYAYVIGPDRLQVLTDVGGWLAAGRRSGLDRHPRLGCHRPPRQAAAPPVLTRPLPGGDPCQSQPAPRRPWPAPPVDEACRAGAPPLKASNRDAAWWLRHYVADALKQSNLAMVAAGSLS